MNKFMHYVKVVFAVLVVLITAVIVLADPSESNIANGPEKAKNHKPEVKAETVVEEKEPVVVEVIKQCKMHTFNGPKLVRANDIKVKFFYLDNHAFPIAFEQGKGDKAKQFVMGWRYSKSSLITDKPFVEGTTESGIEYKTTILNDNGAIRVDIGKPSKGANLTYLCK